jgi:hypothetical protein
MTRQDKTSESITVIAGGALVGLGLHILSGNLDTAADQLRHLLGNTVGDALGVLPSVVLASSQAAQAYALDHHGFLQCFLRMLVSFWPLLLVVVGTVLLRDVFAGRVKASPIPNQYFQRNIFKNKSKDIGCRFRCPSFDV